MPRRRGNGAVIVWSIGAIALIAMILGIVALSIQGSIQPAMPAQRPKPVLPVVRIERNMIKLAEGMYCVESAAMPESSPVRQRVESRIMLLYEKDLHGASSSDEPLPNQTNVGASCSNHIAEGAIWKGAHEVIIDPTNDDGIPRQLIVDMISASVHEWESRLTTIVVTGQDTNGCVDGFDGDSPDGKNEVMFGFIEEQGVLAMTVIWGIFGGPVQDREILETDIIFNLHFPWGNASLNPNVFDIFNIGTHEHGHAMGEGHNNVAGATMFPTASTGETQKRNLLVCEANGLCDAYGGAKAVCTGQSGPTITPFVDVGFQSRCGGTPSASNALLRPYAMLLVVSAAVVVRY